MSNYLRELRGSEINKQTQDFEVLSSQNFPETIILLVTTHGEIILDEEGQVPKFVVPNDMTIIRSLSSIVGECNIVDPDMVNKYAKIINNISRDLETANINKQIKYVGLVTNAIRDIDIKNLDTIKSDIENMKKNGMEENLQLYQGYNYGMDRSHTITTIGAGNEIINKTYVRTDNEATKYDWIIKVMNLPGRPELLKYLTRPNRVGGESTITLENIVDFLKSKGVKTIIIFDISCSNIKDSERYDVDTRTARRERRNLQSGTTMKYGGKRKKKTKKNKKRRKRTFKKLKYSRK